MDTEKLKYTFRNYDPDTELTGNCNKDHGHDLVDKALERFGSIEMVPSLIQNNYKGSKIAFKKKYSVSDIEKMQELYQNHYLNFLYKKARNPKKDLIEFFKGIEKEGIALFPEGYEKGGIKELEKMIGEVKNKFLLNSTL